MNNQNNWTNLASESSIKKTMAALKEHNIESLVVENGEEAKKKVLELLPEKAEVMTMTSETVKEIGLDQEIDQSGRYDAVRPKLNTMSRETQALEMQKLGAAPEWAVGSVHAVTEDGKVLIASNTGSQLAGYVYGSLHLIWIVGTQKIVPTVDEGIKRIYEYVLPLESDRARRAYGMPHSNVSKLLIVNKETKPNRITIIFVKQQLGF